MDDKLKEQVSASNSSKMEEFVKKQPVANDELTEGRKYVLVIYQGTNAVAHCIATFDRYLEGDGRYPKPLMSFDFITANGQFNFQMVQDGASMIYPYDGEFEADFDPEKDTIGPLDYMLAFNYPMYQIFRGKAGSGKA